MVNGLFRAAAAMFSHGAHLQHERILSRLRNGELRPASPRNASRPMLDAAHRRGKRQRIELRRADCDFAALLIGYAGADARESASNTSERDDSLVTRCFELMDARAVPAFVVVAGAVRRGQRLLLQ